MPDPSQYGVRDGGCNLHIEHAARIFCGQVSQRAVIGERHERIEIVLRVIRRRFKCDTEDCVL